MYTNAMFCNCPSLTHRGWALASHTRPVGLPRRFAAVRTWIPLASRGARPDHVQSSRCGDSLEPLGGLLEAFWIRHLIFDRLRSPLPWVHLRTVLQNWARTAHAVRMHHARAASSYRSEDFRQGAGTSRFARPGSNLGLRGRWGRGGKSGGKGRGWETGDDDNDEDEKGDEGAAAPSSLQRQL